MPYLVCKLLFILLNQRQMKKKATILAVDDSVTNIILLEGILKTEGYTIITAMNGKEALKLLKGNPPDLVLLDLMMPYLDGFKFLEQMKEDAEIKAIPVIVVSSKTAPEDVEMARKLGAADYIKKPVDIHQLIDKVDYILENEVA